MNETSGRRYVLATACLGAFMATMDTSLVNVALPHIAAAFGSSISQISWVVLTYLLTNASLLISSGRMSDLLPPGRLFILGVVIFGSASLLGSMSPNLGWLLAWRVCQGVGAALMLGVSPKLITLVYPEGERGLPLGLLSMSFASGITFGAPLGGFVLSYLSWPAVFLVNPVIAIPVVVAGSRQLLHFKAEKPWNWQSLDLWGGLSLTGTLVLLILTLTWIREGGNTTLTLAALVSTGGAFALLLWVESRQPAPLLHKELLRRRGFIIGSLGVLLAFAAVMGAFFLLPFFLGQIYAFTPFGTGLMMAVLSLSNAVISPLGGFAADRLGNVRVVRLSTILVFLGLIALAQTSPETSTWGLAGLFALIGLGFGLFQAPNLNEILRGLPPAFLGLAASTNSVLKNLGALLGVVVTVMALSFGQSRHISLKSGGCPDISCFHWAFYAAAVIAGLNLLLNLFPRPRQELDSSAQ
ncbi:MAG: MFS transporter [Deltaproteobacteria bacterium]|nr:MFS transporter [Deltaproteobacteria bacterium]